MSSVPPNDNNNKKQRNDTNNKNNNKRNNDTSSNTTVTGIIRITRIRIRLIMQITFIMLLVIDNSNKQNEISTMKNKWT